MTLHTAGNITLNVLESGVDPSRPLAVLLHGFPDTALLSWHRQIGYLASKGYHVIAPDMRGYNTSDKPVPVSAYDLDHLTQDIRALIVEYAGRSSAAVVVGHDWGGMVASTLAVHYPELVERLVLMDIAHGPAAVQHMSENPSQLLKSWYIFFFQIPALPEHKFRGGNYSGIISSYAPMAKRGVFGRPVLERLREACSQPRALTSMINYYRQMVRGALAMKDPMVSPEERQQGITQKQDARLRMPTLIIFGKDDAFVEWASGKLTFDHYIHPSVKSQSKFVLIDNAEHWVMHDAPERVNEEIHSFLSHKTSV